MPIIDEPVELRDVVSPIKEKHERKRTGYWSTRDERKIRICDITDRHLANIIKHLERQFEAQKEDLVRSMHDTLSTLQGDMAQFCMEGVIDKVENMTIEDVSAMWHDLVGEALDREVMRFNEFGTLVRKYSGQED